MIYNLYKEVLQASGFQFTKVLLFKILFPIIRDTTVKKNYTVSQKKKQSKLFLS